MVINNATDRSFKDYLIPYYSCVFKSTLSKEVILSRINNRTEAEQLFRRRGILASNKVIKEYEGQITSARFKISRINKRKKSNAAVLIGDLSSSNQYTTVKVKMRLSLLLLVIAPIWMFFMAQLFFEDTDLFNFGTTFNIATLLPILFLLIIYISITASFHFNLKKDFKFLKEVIEPIDNSKSSASWIIRN